MKATEVALTCLVPSPDHRIIDDFIVYWDDKRAGRMAPRPGDIVLADLPTHVPNLVMVDLLDGGADFRFRYIGARVVKTLGRDSTGLRFSAVYRDSPEALAQLMAVFRLTVTERCPIYSRGRVSWLPARDDLYFVAATVPLSEDGLTISAVLDEVLIFH
jgi:PAS domain-containing protein